MYTFMWISVDRYLAVRKPLRYETVQTRTSEWKQFFLSCHNWSENQGNQISFINVWIQSTGCQCWMCFTWISAAMLCCPSLWTEKDAIFDKYAYVCSPNFNHMAAYSVTLGLYITYISKHQLSVDHNCSNLFFVVISIGILVLGPSVISLLYNYGYIFKMMWKIKSGVAIHDKE